METELVLEPESGFELDLGRTYAVIRCNCPLVLDACDRLVQVVDSAVKNYDQCPLVVLDLNQQKKVGPNFSRVALSIRNQLREKNGEFVLVNPTDACARFLELQGISVQMFRTLKDALDKNGLSLDTAATPLKLDVQFVNPFINATLSTFSVQCSVAAEAGTPFLKGQKNSFSPDIAGVIGLVSPKFKGNISLLFPNDTFLSIMSRTFGEKYTEITPSLEDGAGELLNIISGQAKAELNKNRYAIERAIPAVVTGTGLEVVHVSSGPTVVVPFETRFGPFNIEINFDL